MKKIIPFCVLLVLAACNNNAGNSNADIPEKEKQLRQAISEHPDSLLLTENLIQYFRDNSNYSEAIAETDKALQKDSVNERLLYIKATLQSENDDTLHAIQSWERLIKVRPDPQYLMSLGTLYAFTKDPLALAMGDLLMVAGNRYWAWSVASRIWSSAPTATAGLVVCLRTSWATRSARSTSSSEPIATTT